MKTRTLERPLANDGSFYTVPVCRRIDDFHFSCGTVSKSKFTSCLIKFTKFEVSFKVLVGKKLLRLILVHVIFVFRFEATVVLSGFDAMRRTKTDKQVK